MADILNDFVWPCVTCFGGTLAFSIVYNVEKKMLFLATLGGTAGWLVYLLFGGLFPNDLPQYFLSAAFIAAYAEIMARVHKKPAIVYLLPGLFPLVPGGPIYYTMEAVLSGDTLQFLSKLVYTLETSGSIALGVLLSTSISQLLFGRILRKKVTSVNRQDPPELSTAEALESASSHTPTDASSQL